MYYVERILKLGSSWGRVVQLHARDLYPRGKNGTIIGKYINYL
jgi:hypothetical protein